MRPHIVPALPVSFALPVGKAIKLALPESEAFDALLAHKATDEQFGIIECVCEVGVRAIIKARKAPHCRHLTADGLTAALRDFHRGGHALKRAQARRQSAGVYGLDAEDRQCIIEMREWHGLLNTPGNIPRAIWFAALRDSALQKAPIVLPPWDTLSL